MHDMADLARQTDPFSLGKALPHIGIAMADMISWPKGLMFGAR
jgi:hypothetical protein